MPSRVDRGSGKKPACIKVRLREILCAMWYFDAYHTLIFYIKAGQQIIPWAPYLLQWTYFHAAATHAASCQNLKFVLGKTWAGTQFLFSGIILYATH